MRLRHRLPSPAWVLVVVLGIGLPLTAGSAAAAPNDLAPAGPVAMAAADEYTFTGHGWGHGRGMGQYGALGYAVDHGWNYGQILGHFYNNTTAGAIGNPQISVELLARRGAPLVVTGTNLTINDVPVGAVGLVARLEANGTVRINAAGACSNEGAVIGTYPAGVKISTASQASVDALVQVCDPTGRRAYRGHLTVQPHASTGAQTVFNWLPIESYLRGVVPRESPASWGSLGSNRGMEALKAQSVAARSYAWSGGNYASGSKTCDTTACQVYGGAKVWNAQYPSGYVLEAANTDAAIAATAGQVRLMPGGAVARTEFSSSTGGYTAGGTFPAVPDAGDAISINPNHNWTTTLTTATIASRLGIPGPVRDVRVTARNGLGDWGGRVTQVAVVDANGTSRTYTGAQFRTAMGTATFKSDWFTIDGISRAEAENVVRALYVDILGRQVDASGLKTWTDYVVSTGSPSALAERIATSRERMNKLVAAQYRKALLREPEPAGLENWVRHLEAGRGVYELQIGIYGSPESLHKLGGGDVGTWVGALYTELLGREAGASERQYWAGVAASRGRQVVVAGIAGSTEASMRRLNVYYQTFLQRDVDPSGRSTFLPMMTGRGDFVIPVKLGSSPEYWSRAQSRTY